jgi:hypothetical protein
MGRELGSHDRRPDLGGALDHSDSAKGLELLSSGCLSNVHDGFRQIGPSVVLR